MHFYTSVNNNYIPKARILAKTVKKHCPDAKFSLVLADEIPEGLDLELEYFDEIVLVEELGIPVNNLNLWIFMHTVVELCTAIKGQALVKFLEEGSEKVIYLDPDIAVFDDLHELEHLMDQYDIIITPHQTIPETEKRDVINNEICSLKHGIYNFGFFAVRNSENGVKYARWWRDRLVEFCYDDIPNGLFTDQRWGDLAPAMFDGVYIWKDAGCNVSTWNLTNRQITFVDGIYYVNGSKLKFYHFSGFDSGAQKIMLDLYGKDNPHLHNLRQWYIDEQDMEGQRIFGIGYGKSKYNYYDNDQLIPKEARILMRSRMDLLEYFGNCNPYITEQERSYYYWYKKEMKSKVPEETLLRKQIEQLSGEKKLLEEQKNEMEQKLQIQLAEVQKDRIDLTKTNYRLQHELEQIYNSKTWKIRNRILKLIGG